MSPCGLAAANVARLSYSVNSKPEMSLKGATPARTN